MSCLLRVYIGSRVGILSSGLPSSRCYGHTKTTEDYKTYRKELTSLRWNLMKQNKHHIKMTTEDVGSQVAQEARMEKQREQRALEENERELKRMAEIRELKLIEIEEMRQKRIEHGIEARMKAAAELKERRTKEVLDMIERSKNFVTMENLEEKINEALENEVSHNFALSIKGEIVNTPPSVPNMTRSTA